MRRTVHSGGTTIASLSGGLHNGKMLEAGGNDGILKVSKNPSLSKTEQKLLLLSLCEESGGITPNYSSLLCMLNPLRVALVVMAVRVGALSLISFSHEPGPE